MGVIGFSQASSGRAGTSTCSFVIIPASFRQSREEALVVFTCRSKLFFTFVLNFRFGRKLSVIRGIVEQEIQAMVSKRENVATHHSYQAWDPVPSLSPATTGTGRGYGT